MNRRDFLVTSAVAAVLAGMPALGAAADPAPFSFDLLTERMKERAAEAYKSGVIELVEPLASLDYDRHRAIRYRPDHAIWHGAAPFELQAFHMGWLFKEPVHLYSVEDGQARDIHITGHEFEYRPPLEAASFENIELPGVAGFRIHNALNRPDVMDELAAFLGASYFRALGRGNVYGLSARGLALNTATQAGEEFPRFDAFYIQRPAADADRIVIWATMDSPSVTGAFEFVIVPGADTVMEVTARLFLRQDVTRLGIAPLTSMFLFAENNRSAFRDYRNAVHDSDGLKIVRHNGEESWRSLANPGRLATSFFAEENPRAFGLFQRDREFANYQDAGASYERRPSAVVEPLGPWGKGSVALIEIPTDLEINDNIVAFWVPEGEVKAGQELEFRYRLTWGAIDESGVNLARVDALRAGHGGVAGTEIEKGLQKFVVDFAGGPLSEFASGDAGPQSSVSVKNAEVRHSTLERLEANGMWRLVVDIDSFGEDPVELSAYLVVGEKRISETWLYQWRSVDDQRR